ncbi:MAG: hypothetical protein J6Q22_02520 [Prevotella sp.]|nr:hypothetical protein [Prevotella sp.]
MNKRQWCAFLILATTALHAVAQNIDFNMTNRQDAEVNEPDYIGWAVNQGASESKTLENGLTITVAAAGKANTLRAQWHKNTCTAGRNGQTGLRLLGDGVVAFIADASNNTPNLTDTPTGISVKLKGLKPGLHSLAAYHVYKDPKSGDMPTIKVDVMRDQETVAAQTGMAYANVKATASDLKMSDAAFSYIEFEVLETTQTITVTYTTEVETGKKYQTTNVMLNGLLIDRSPLTAMDPKPGHRDYHLDADDGSYTLQWTPAAVAVKHKLVVGTEQETVSQSTDYIYEGTDPAYTITGLSSSRYYFWRVDEVDADGRIHKGQVWSFRPRHLAFPGAEGYGRFATGGRGGKVYHVTTLSGGKEPGSLLYGLTEMNEPRYIVFDVSGVIELDFDSHFVKPYAYIAGQTAPGKGICIKASNINIGSDVICRHIRFKRGLGVYGENTGNAMGMSGADHAIVDHCTAAWGTDETVSGRGALNITFQYNIISEALGITGHKNYADGTNHGYAATIDGRIGSWHHNLLVNCEGRNWSMGGGMDGNNRPIGGLDLFNNVVYNWHNRTTDGNCHAVNFVNNYYKMGADTRKTILFTQDFEDAIAPDGIDQAYIKGNIRENKSHSLTQDALNDTYNATGNIPTTYQYRVNKPLFESYATIHTAKDAMKIVTSDAGATMPMRDEHHIRNIRETLDGTHTYVGSKSKIKGEIDTETDITEHADGKGWEVYPEEARPENWDTDQDGMPDWYEALIHSDAHTANQNDDLDSDGWTLLEDYLELMAHPYVVVEPNGMATLDLKPYFAGFYGQNKKAVTPSYRLPDETNGGFSASIEGSALKIHSSSGAQGIGRANVTVDDGETTFTQPFGIIISGEWTAIQKPTVDFNQIEAVKREFFTSDGRQVSTLKSHGVYVMKVTDKQGTVHTAKIIAR